MSLLRRINYQTKINIFFETSTSGSYVIPNRARNLVVELWGAGGGGGGCAFNDGFNGGGGGGGGYSKITKALTTSDWQKSISFTIANGGAVGNNVLNAPGVGGGNAGQSTASVTGFSFGSFTLTCNGGTGGGGADSFSDGTPGTGGTASGGDTNLTGIAGGQSNVWDAGYPAIILANNAGFGGNGGEVIELLAPSGGYAGLIRLYIT